MRDPQGAKGHGYFANNPAVSSDLIALIRYRLEPGVPGRPLRPVVPPIIWEVKTDLVIQSPDNLPAWH